MRKRHVTSIVVEEAYEQEDQLLSVRQKVALLQLLAMICESVAVRHCVRLTHSREIDHEILTDQNMASAHHLVLEQPVRETRVASWCRTET